MQVAAPPPHHGPLRPTFERYVPGVDARSLGERVERTLGAEGHDLPYRRTSTHFLVWLPDDERRLWSPWLHLDLTDADDAVDGSDAVRMFGRFHPAPNLWTAVMFSCLTLGVTAVGGALLAYCQHMVDEHPWGWWLSIAALVGLAGVLATSRIGQQRARGQMKRLVAFVDTCAGV